MSFDTHQLQNVRGCQGTIELRMFGVSAVDAEGHESTVSAYVMASLTLANPGG